jgi:hypothetical protein
LIEPTSHPSHLKKSGFPPSREGHALVKQRWVANTNASCIDPNLIPPLHTRCQRAAICASEFSNMSFPALTRRTLLQFLPLTSLMALGGCTAPRDIRARMSLQVATPEGSAVGASVWETRVSIDNVPLKGLGFPIHSKVRGEAVVVDLGQRGLLFMLMTNDPRRPRSIGGLLEVVLRFFPTQDVTYEYFDALKKRRPEYAMDFSSLPMLVRFADLNDPKTVERVDPANLEASFGPGVKLESAIIEITDAPVTTGIEKRLNWIGVFPEPSLFPSGDPLHPPFAKTIHHGDFRRGQQ